MARPRYLYRVVTHNGAGVHSTYFRTLPKAREACRKIAEQQRPILERIGYEDWFEIERALEVNPHAFRYWMRRRKRWVLWDPNQDASDRDPDFVIRAGKEKAA